MIHVVPLISSESNQVFTTTLDGEDFQVRLLWNARVGRWFISLLDAEGNRLATGRKLTTDQPLFWRDTLPGLPPGYLWPVDMTGTGADPELRDLGQRTLLPYVDEEGVGG